MSIDIKKIRNFCIIAHIDHGKSTLADRLIELTGTVSNRDMKQQLLDSMDLEREKGITIKLQPVQMEYNGYYLNLIDTPGHVDFSYEVSRSLAACEGALLLVDAAQGIQAQTLANLYLALQHDLEIIPIINKIDLPAAQVEDTKAEIIELLGCTEEDILCISAKTGLGVDKIPEKVIDKIPEPTPSENKETKALIFDSIFDEYKGVIAYVRMFNGSLKPGDKVRLMATNKDAEILEVGVFKPMRVPTKELEEGTIGYAVTGFKDVGLCRVGDTLASQKVKEALPGYKKVIPMVYAGIFCGEGTEYAKLRLALEKLKLNDAALEYEPDNSPALGMGFRCGFLGLLHLEIFQERLSREFNLNIIVTAPSVVYKIFVQKGIREIKREITPENIIKTEVPEEGFIFIHNPEELPDPSQIEHVEEPIVKVDIFTPEKYLGKIMELCQDKRGIYINTEYVSGQSTSQNRIVMHYELPLSSILVDFYDTLKSISSGFASLNYEFKEYKKVDVVKMDVHVGEERVEALSTIVYRKDVYRVGRKIVLALKKAIPRSLFEIKIQAAIGGKVIASERISAMRKDVTAKLYGGDVTRKRKLLEKQKKGKKKMKAGGRVEIPAKAFLAVLQR